MEFRRNSPSPWTTCKSFEELVQVLFVGKSFTHPQAIPGNKNREATENFEEIWKERILEGGKAAQRSYEERLEIYYEYIKKLEEYEEEEKMHGFRVIFSENLFDHVV